MDWIFYESPQTRRMLSILRIVVGAVFVTYGTSKLFGYPPSPVPMGPIDLISERGVAGMLEVVGGLAIVVGLLTRPMAFILAGEMAVAYFQVHFPNSPFPTVNNGVPAVLYCFIFLYLAFAGAGPWSLDALIGRAPRPLSYQERFNQTTGRRLAS
jgi:putative oxidoreductase